MQLEELQQSRFSELLQSEFQVLDDPAAEFAVRLVEVIDRSNTPHQEVFTLLFHGPANYFISQGIHKLKHRNLGEIEIFLVPVGQDKDGFHYEAVFNRFVS